MSRRQLVHPSWCVRDGLGEHRGAPVSVPGRVSAVVTLVQYETGGTFAEVRASFRLPGTDERGQAAALLRALARVRAELSGTRHPQK